MRVKFFCVPFLVILLHAQAFGQSRTNLLNITSDPRGPAEVVVCSQNLRNFGVYSDVKKRVPDITSSELRLQEQALIRRFVKAQCDVIAAQEILSSSEQGAKLVLEKLSQGLRAETNRFFTWEVGESSDKYLRVGFLVAKDRAEVINRTTYRNIELPKISENQKPRFFVREPFEVQLGVKPMGEGAIKVLTLITFHFKSKGGGSRDPTGLEFEPYRMEMAEALRRIVELRHASALSSGKTILLLLGDRNSNFDSASAKILEGALKLRQFQGSAPCRLSKRGVPLCKAGASQPQELFSVLTSDPRIKERQGTYHYKGVYSWIDDILMPAVALPFAWEGPTSTGKYAAGVIYEPSAASDHALVWVQLNW
ncbi:MAG: hypothetical protein GX589_09225 [Deltaproteobacteria bacterium]|nr:hypothetical protein [Deltaproteobacteria bacterium]